MNKINLLDLTESELIDLMNGFDAKPFHGTQIFKWVHQFGIHDVDKMSNLSLILRNKLKENSEITLPKLLKEQISLDGTIKWLLQLACGNSIEVVYIPEPDRGTLCISSQVGCPLYCRFCFTGQSGFKRNLTVSEIIGQVQFAIERLVELKELTEFNLQKNRIITNVVFMGMGEPLLNYTNVVKSLNILLNDNAYGLSKHRVTVSTSGIVPKLKLLSQVSPVALTISLHAANNKLRDELVPINKKFPLELLIETCKNYFPSDSKRKITFAYLMLRNVNDSKEDAQALVKLLNGVKSKVNLIPFNSYPRAIFSSSSPETIRDFQSLLLSKGMPTTIRKTRGKDILASCGQLKGQFND